MINSVREIIFWKLMLTFHNQHRVKLSNIDTETRRIKIKRCIASIFESIDKIDRVSY